MKKLNVLLFVFIMMTVPLQQSCAQTSLCPANNEKAEQELKDFLLKEKNIKTLRDRDNMPISNNAINNIKPLTGEANSEECRQLRSNLEWLEDQKHYSIYKVADHYFIVLYSFTKGGRFHKKEIPIINSKFEAIGTIIEN